MVGMVRRIRSRAIWRVAPDLPLTLERQRRWLDRAMEPGTEPRRGACGVVPAALELARRPAECGSGSATSGLRVPHCRNIQPSPADDSTRHAGDTSRMATRRGFAIKECRAPHVEVG